MSGRNRLAEVEDDPIVAGALKHFKASVDAWSEAAYSQPRSAVMTTRHTWRLAATWALGCLLAAGSLAGTLYERHVQRESARIAAMKAAIKAVEQRAALVHKTAEQPVAARTNAAQPPIAAKNASNEDEDLFANLHAFSAKPLHYFGYQVVVSAR